MREVKLNGRPKQFCESVQARRKKIDLLGEIIMSLLTEVRKEVRAEDLFIPVKVEEGISFNEEIKNFEINLISQALEVTGGNQKLAARLLNLNYTTLNAKIKRYAIDYGSRSRFE